MYLYVMGRGHSGSTILDILLGSGQAIESVGELVSGLERYASGEPLRLRRLDARLRVLEPRCGAGSRPRAMAGPSSCSARVPRPTSSAGSAPGWRARTIRSDRHLAAMTAALARAIAGSSGKPHMLDSNKETARGLFLLRYLPEARVIHLVRDPRGIQQSHHWRVAGGRGFKLMRRTYRAGWTGPLFLLLAAVAWTVGNGLSELAARMAPERVLRLRYEDSARRSDRGGAHHRPQVPDRRRRRRRPDRAQAAAPGRPQCRRQPYPARPRGAVRSGTERSRPRCRAGRARPR